MEATVKAHTLYQDNTLHPFMIAGIKFLPTCNKPEIGY